MATSTGLALWFEGILSFSFCLRKTEILCDNVLSQKAFSLSLLYYLYKNISFWNNWRQSSYQVNSFTIIRNWIRWRLSFWCVTTSRVFKCMVLMVWHHAVLQKKFSIHCNPNKHILLEGKHFNRLYHFVPFTTLYSYVNLRYVTEVLGSS